MNKRDLTIPIEGSSMPAYLARPEEESGAHPAVIVLQEVFGFTPEVKRMTDMLAGIGYVGLAINYYHRIDPQMNQPYTEEGSREAFAASRRVTAENVAADIAAAVDWLNAQDFVKAGKIAVWGSGFGATLALQMAANEELSGAVLFYPTRADVTAEPRIPLLLVFGEEDYYVSRSEMDRLIALLNEAGADLRVQVYPKVGHSFFRHGRPEAIVEQRRYSDEAVAQAVADSWNVMQRFLRDIFSRKTQVRPAETGDIHTLHTQQVR